VRITPNSRHYGALTTATIVRKRTVEVQLLSSTGQIFPALHELHQLVTEIIHDNEAAGS
jgi:hypothetical protein